MPPPRGVQQRLLTQTERRQARVDVVGLEPNKGSSDHRILRSQGSDFSASHERKTRSLTSSPQNRGYRSTASADAMRASSSSRNGDRPACIGPLGVSTQPE